MGRNQTIRLSEEERRVYGQKLITTPLEANLGVIELTNRTINGDVFDVLRQLPRDFVDLLILDPPYNISKQFNTVEFTQKTSIQYIDWVRSWLFLLVDCLKFDASIYVCNDWQMSGYMQILLNEIFVLRNRITWERDKGRSSQTNWKNNHEDIWFCTVSSDYYFNADAVKHRRKVIAPYRDDQGGARDWSEGDEGDKTRLTGASNLWSDITVPFWSMPENTDHSTQKPEKLIAKLILASTKEGGFVFDPFVGSGTTSVVAKKLNRQFLGIEKDFDFACITEKRLEIAETDQSIQGYADGAFLTRNMKS